MNRFGAVFRWSRPHSRRRVLTTVTAAVLATAPLAIDASPVRASTQAHRAAPDAVRPAGRVNTWTPTGSMQTIRAGQTATLLDDGKVLVAGGGTASAELYDPATRTFSPAGSMATSRTNATATLLPDGDVLVAGGSRGHHQLATAELYRPSSGTWAATGSMHTPRSGMTATLLTNGDVLVAGGGCNRGAGHCSVQRFLSSLRSAELYHPSTGTWTRTGAMSVGREYFTANLLGNGDALVAGGFAGCEGAFCTDTATAELYDPSSGAWTRTADLATGLEQQTATTLQDGKVLVAGGSRLNPYTGHYRRLSRAEVYDPEAAGWTRTGSLLQTHSRGTASLLPNGWVLVAGGGTTEAEVYEPALGAWVRTGSMNTRRSDAAAVSLTSGDVLVTGGGVDSAETYRAGSGPLLGLAPSALRFRSRTVDSTSPARRLVVTNDGDSTLHVYGVGISGAHPGDYSATSGCTSAVAPGESCTVNVTFRPSASGLRAATVRLLDNGPDSPQVVQVTGYGKGPRAWVPTGSMSIGRSQYATGSLTDGNVLIAGGQIGRTSATADAEVYNTTTGRFTATGPLNSARSEVAAAVLPDGRVLVAGGISNDVPLSSAELYNPRTRAWSLTAPMHQTGYALTETVLPDGEVLVTGLGGGSKAEVYDPVHDTWTNTGPTIGVGQLSTATLLPDGQVLAAGDGSTAAGLYDPGSNEWTATGSMTTARTGAQAVLLPNGDVLVVGGSTPGGGALASSELYDPASGTWTSSGNTMSTGRRYFSLALTPNNVVLAIGGCSDGCNHQSILSSVDAYNISDGEWSAAAPMVQARAMTTAVVLGNGDVLVAGGDNFCCRNYPTAEVFTTTVITPLPPSGQAGQTIKLRGHGYYAFERVKILWDYGLVTKTRTGSLGGFSTPIVIPQAAAGQHTITALGSTSLAVASCTFTVVQQQGLRK